MTQNLNSEQNKEELLQRILHKCSTADKADWPTLLHLADALVSRQLERQNGLNH